MIHNMKKPKTLALKSSGELRALIQGGQTITLGELKACARFAMHRELSNRDAENYKRYREAEHPPIAVDPVADDTLITL